MFAWLRTVAGEVAVIPNGDVAKWSSKKKVPIAGYLCTTEHGPVLHTLPTPCLPTSLDENGQPFEPPLPPPPGAFATPQTPPPQPAGLASPAPAPESADPVQFHSEPSSVPVSEDSSVSVSEAEAEAEAAAAEA